MFKDGHVVFLGGLLFILVVAGFIINSINILGICGGGNFVQGSKSFLVSKQTILLLLLFRM